MEDRKSDISKDIKKIICRHFEEKSRHFEARRLANDIVEYLDSPPRPKVRLPQIKISVEKIRNAAEEINIIAAEAQRQVEEVCENLADERFAEPKDIIKILEEWAAKHAPSNRVDMIDYEISVLRSLQEDFDAVREHYLEKRYEPSSAFDTSRMVDELGKGDLYFWFIPNAPCWRWVDGDDE